MTEQRRWLAEYAASGSEQAFGGLVGCYIDLCYSTALRLVDGDMHLAEDVTQVVFADLARLAGTISVEVKLGGWLHRRTCHVAATLMRKERRRRQRERCAAELNAMNSHDETRFEQIAPLLDEAINGLGARDRAAILLRYFEKRDLRTIGETLGSNEDAAQKRVARALEKLRGHFARRGVTVSSTVIAAMLAANAVQAAPVGLAAGVATASLAMGAGVESFSLAATMTQSVLMKKTALVIFAVILVTGIAIPITVAKVKQARANAPITERALRKGLVLHLTFDSDETAGQVTDISTAENHGRAVGVRWTPDGKRRGAYEFTADGNEIVITNNESLNPEQLTLAAWIKTSTADTVWRRIFDKSYSKGFALSVAADWQGNQWSGLASLEIGPGPHLNVTKSKVADGQWHHVVATCDGNEQCLFVDGQSQGTPLRWRNPGAVAMTDFNLVIGCNRSNFNEDDLGTSFRGLIDEPMVWNRALSPKEVAFLFQSQDQAITQAVAVH